MMSIMNNNQPEIQGDSTNLPNPDQPFDGIERDSRISTEEGCTGSSPVTRKTEMTSRIWEDRSSVLLEEMDVAAEKARIFGEPSGSSQINLWLETRVSESLCKTNMSIQDASVQKPRDQHMVDEEVLEVSAERDSSTHSYDSYGLESSELSSTLMGNWSPGFEKGDMVWGKVKSHPWWPGVIFNDALASPAVRRMKKKGLVLVAFFGDNSYGWFDPAELVPFVPYFTEKSRQTTSKNFVKAVEDAVDRSSRTRALGLTCRCRNKFNFRPISIPGYHVVDVVNSEFSDVYSTAQIKNARDAFVPADLMDFLKQMSVLSMDVCRSSRKVEWSNNIAMLLSLRKVLFEEFDETYAQAFGVDPVRPTSRNALGALGLPLTQSTRAAPLSGPLVYAEELGGKKRTPGKSTGKGSKDKAKKDKYLFKRRDDVPTGLSESPSATEIRSPVVDVSAATPEKTHITLEQGDAPGYFKNVLLGEGRLGSVGKQAASGLPTPEFVLQKRVAADNREGLSAASSFVNEIKLDTPVLVGNNNRGGDIKSGMIVEKKPLVSSVDQVNLDRTQHVGTVGAKKEMKLQKNENEDVAVSIIPEVVLKKKRGKRKGWVRRDDVTADQKLGSSWMPNRNMVDFRRSFVHPELQKNDKLLSSAGKPTGMFDFAITPSPPPPLPPSSLDLNPQDLDMSLILSDMLAFALDPFHGSNRNAPLIVRNVFLRFRNLVFQKSLAPPPPEEADAFQIQSSKSSEQPDILRRGVAEAVVPVPKRGLHSSLLAPASQAKQLPKSIVRPDDPTKSGRKRPPSSDRQEPVPAKKGKKLKKLKELEPEKKTFPTQKAPPVSLKEEGGSRRTTVAAAVNKSSKANVGKKQDLPLPTPVPKKKQVVKKQEKLAAAAVPKVPSPTYLFMKFPPRATLPSISSMKARFARFGPLDLDGARVYWGSYTCKMLFKYRADAQTAYMYANDNEIFGPFKVNYSLRDLEESPDESFLSKRIRGDDSMTDKSYPVKVQKQTLQQQSTNVQLKSCLKKASGDGVPTREAPRVKFLLDGGEAGRREPIVVPGRSGIVGNNTSSHSLPSKNLNSVKSKSVYFPPPKQVKPPPSFSVRTNENPLQQLPSNQRPSYYGKGQQQQQKQHIPASTVSGSRKVGVTIVDISSDMLNLMRKCSDIVSNVRSTFGHVPYHPL